MRLPGGRFEPTTKIKKQTKKQTKKKIQKILNFKFCLSLNLA